jgi:hypothetical protein
MVALAATNSATPSLQSTLMRGRIYAARQQAQQAEAQAQDLRAQADAQEQLVQQAHQRVQTLERGANAGGASKPTRPAPDQTTTAIENGTTYANVLADVYRLAKPLLEFDLAPPQKNLVASSLFTATNTVWSAQQSGPQAVAQYDLQAANGVGKTVGQLIDTRA